MIFDVEIHNPERFQDYMTQVKPLVDAAGGHYLLRGEDHKVYEGDWISRWVGFQ